MVRAVVVFSFCLFFSAAATAFWFSAVWLLTRKAATRWRLPWGPLGGAPVGRKSSQIADDVNCLLPEKMSSGKMDCEADWSAAIMGPNALAAWLSAAENIGCASAGLCVVGRIRRKFARISSRDLCTLRPGMGGRGS